MLKNNVQVKLACINITKGMWLIDFIFEGGYWNISRLAKKDISLTGSIVRKLVSLMWCELKICNVYDNENSESFLFNELKP